MYHFNNLLINLLLQMMRTISGNVLLGVCDYYILRGQFPLSQVVFEVVGFLHARGCSAGINMHPA